LLDGEALHRASNAQAPEHSRQITAVTRRDIIGYLRAEGAPWWGRLGETDFLGQLYDLDTLPPADPRYTTAREDVVQHRVTNSDWDDEWVFDYGGFAETLPGAVSQHCVRHAVPGCRHLRRGGRRVKAALGVGPPGSDADQLWVSSRVRRLGAPGQMLARDGDVRASGATHDHHRAPSAVQAGPHHRADRSARSGRRRGRAEDEQVRPG
jgi:hypothetical protein